MVARNGVGGWIGNWIRAAALGPVLGLALAASSAPAAMAQDAVAGNFKLDTSQPIEINADTLEVLQNDQTAIFQGRVDAVQGEFRLRADKLTVNYDAGENAGAAGGTADLAAGGGEIRKLSAEGAVHITSVRETAKGDWATYDVASNRIEMGGGVTLTQGETVIRGEKLEIDLVTGRSKMTGGAGAGGRVRSVFSVPEKKKN